MAFRLGTLTAAAAAAIVIWGGRSPVPAITVAVEQTVSEDRRRIPVSSTRLVFEPPAPAEATLPNGLRLVVFEDRRLPQVTFQIVIGGAGGYFDPEATPGVAALTSSMLSEGTSRRTGRELAEKLETMASTVNVSAGMATTTVTVSGSSLTEHVGSTFELASEMVLTPDFSRDALARVKRGLQATISQQQAGIPFYAAGRLLMQGLYGSDPGGRRLPRPFALRAEDTAGEAVLLTAAQVDQISREAIAAFHRSRYLPNDAVIAFAGNLSLQQARGLAVRWLGDWQRGTTDGGDRRTTEPASARGIHFLTRDSATQTTLVVGARTLVRADPQFETLRVLNAILNRRLYTRLREERGYAYAAFSVVPEATYRSHLLALVEVRTDVTVPALREVLAEVERLRREPVSERELEVARTALLATFARSLDQPNAVLNGYLASWLYNLPPAYWSQLPKRLSQLTPQELQDAARIYLSHERLMIAGVGNPTALASLREFGPVEVHE